MFHTQEIILNTKIIEDYEKAKIPIGHLKGCVIEIGLFWNNQKYSYFVIIIFQLL